MRNTGALYTTRYLHQKVFTPEPLLHQKWVYIRNKSPLHQNCFLYSRKILHQTAFTPEAPTPEAFTPQEKHSISLSSYLFEERNFQGYGILRLPRKLSVSKYCRHAKWQSEVSKYGKSHATKSLTQNLVSRSLNFFSPYQTGSRQTRPSA